MLDYILSSATYLPHGFCLLWRPDLVALHVVSDVTTGLAYFSIPLAILSFLKRRPDLEYRWVAYLFASFPASLSYAAQLIPRPLNLDL